MNNYNNFYTPKNNIYVIKDKEEKIEKIIGNEEDKLMINAIAILDVHKEIKNSDVQDFILNKAFNPNEIVMEYKK